MSDRRKASFSESDIEERFRFLTFTDQDEDNLKKIHHLIDGEVGPIIDEFYDHLHRFEALRPFLRDAAVVERLKITQRKYLLTLGVFARSQDYIEDRVEIGLVHERVGLGQQWYLGAYQKLFDLIAERIAVLTEDNPIETVSLLTTLRRIFALDASIGVETYHKAGTDRLEDLVQQLRETQAALQLAAHTDSLTGINNRKHLLDTLRTEIYRSRRFDHPFSLLFMDIDRFKSVNDTHGHVFGDFVLKRVATLTSESIRPANVVGRYGGEEFAVGIIECDLDGAKVVAERIREVIEAAEFAQDGCETSITVSLGAAVLDEECRTLEDLIKRADEAMYDAKKGGRNRVCVYEGA